MSNRKLSRVKIKDAIPNTGGLIAAICKKTGYSWGAVRDFIARDEELTAMLKDEQDTIDDMAESTMIKAIRDGDKSAAQWWLSRRRRGQFGDNVDITTQGQKVKGYIGISPDDWDKPDEEG